MSDSLFLPRELFDAASVPVKAMRQAPPTDAVLDDLRRISTPVTTVDNGQRNRRLKPRDPNAPRVDLWLDLAA